MIHIKIPGIKKKEYWPPVSTPTPKTETVNNVVLSISQEATRRDNIVKKKYHEFPLNPGDTAEPMNEHLEKTLGKRLIVVAIAKSYADLGKNDKWPEDDNPLMVHVKSYDKKADFYVTTNAIKRKAAE